MVRDDNIEYLPQTPNEHTLTSENYDGRGRSRRRSRQSGGCSPPRQRPVLSKQSEQCSRLLHTALNCPCVESLYIQNHSREQYGPLIDAISSLEDTIWNLHSKVGVMVQEIKRDHPCSSCKCQRDTGNEDTTSSASSDQTEMSVRGGVFLAERKTASIGPKGSNSEEPLLRLRSVRRLRDNM